MQREATNDDYSLRLEDMDDEERTRRIRAKEPVRAPRQRVGDLVYSSFHKANVPVLGVYWDPGVAGLPSFWRVNTPGYSCSDWNVHSRALSSAPTHRYVKIASSSWMLVETIAGTDREKLVERPCWDPVMNQVSRIYSGWVV